VSIQPHQSRLNSRQSRPLSPRSGRLSRFLLLSALALVVGVLSACGSSDSGEDVEREAAAGTEKCDHHQGKHALRGVNGGVHWFGCNKSGADLRDADLTRANLRNTKFFDADLSDAKLSGADLRSADLTRANLSGADLTGANLDYARLFHADLTGANLSGVSLRGISCSNATVWTDGTKGHRSKCPPTS
jgi:uncharacterized protein YjbI with pentapeptide repeats